MKKYSFLFFILVCLSASALWAADPLPASLTAEEMLRLDEIGMASRATDPPTGEEVVAPAEFGPADGVFLSWQGGFIDIVKQIAKEAAESDTAYILVNSSYQEMSARSELQAFDVNMNNVRFLQKNLNSIWIRDYGPWFIYEDGNRAIIDFEYNRPRPADDTAPTFIGGAFSFPVYEPNLTHPGGNFIVDGNGMGFCTDLIYEENSGSPAQIQQMMQDYMGLDTLVVITPMNYDGTGHIDMFCKLLNDTLFIVGEYSSPSAGASGNYQILNDNAAFLDTLTNLQGRGFDVVRMPMPPYQYGTSYTYTNSLIINNKVLVPVYGFETDAEALAIYEECMPDYDVIGIDCNSIITSNGAIHCITKLQMSADPLILHHESLARLSYSTEDSIRVQFRLEPQFENVQAEVYWRPTSGDTVTTLIPIYENGYWSAILPPPAETFEYGIKAMAQTGEHLFERSFPNDAPDQLFFVRVSGVTAGNVPVQAQILEGCSNYPNPFNPETTIAFNLSQAAKVDLTVYNVKGQKIRTLVSEMQSAGGHSVIWDGTNANGAHVASGLYLYQLQVDGETKAVKKMVLMK